MQRLDCINHCPHLEYCVGLHVWSPYLRQEIDKLQRIQKAIKMLRRGLDKFAYDERLARFGLIQKREERGHLIEACEIVTIALADCLLLYNGRCIDKNKVENQQCRTSKTCGEDPGITTSGGRNWYPTTSEIKVTGLFGKADSSNYGQDNNVRLKSEVLGQG